MGTKRLVTLLASALFAVFVLAACGAEEESKDKDQQASLVGDVITSATVEEAPCVVTSRFERGQRMIFRAKLEDFDTEENIEGAEVKVVLGTGEEFEMELGPHGAEKTMLYTVPYEITDDVPTGVLEYKYVAELDGVEYSYEPFEVEPSKLTIVEASE